MKAQIRSFSGCLTLMYLIQIISFVFPGAQLNRSSFVFVNQSDLHFTVAGSRLDRRSHASTLTACDGALWASEICDSGSHLPLGVGWNESKGSCPLEDENEIWYSKGQACDAVPTEYASSTFDAEDKPVILLVDSTFGDVYGTCGCTAERRESGSYCTEPTHASTSPSDLRPIDWVVFGLVSRRQFTLRHSRCPFIGNETSVTVHAVVLTDRELHYSLHPPNDFAAVGGTERRLVIAAGAPTVAWLLEPPVSISEGRRRRRSERGGRRCGCEGERATIAVWMRTGRETVLTERMPLSSSIKNRSQATAHSSRADQPSFPRATRCRNVRRAGHQPLDLPLRGGARGALRPGLLPRPPPPSS